MGWVAAHRFELGDHAARGVMAVGTSSAVLAAIALLSLGYVLVRHRYRLAASVLVAVVVSTSAAGLLKAMFGRARPPASMALVTASGHSMPSTHAALTASAAAALYIAATWVDPRSRRLVGVALAAGVTAVGVCLVYLGVHWPTDVLAGWALGAAVGAGASAMTNRIYRKTDTSTYSPRTR
jgi:membrane-associated phospholipid phosphatase